MPIRNGDVVDLELGEKHASVLLDNSRKWRYRALWGGRGGGKDWAMADVIVERGVIRPERTLFTREVQKSIRESSHQLISDTIARLGYGDYFDINYNGIKAKHNDTQFLFAGLTDLNADNLKSFEGLDRVVCGEAQYLTRESFDILDPTVRRANSEIWLQFNPKFDDDFVYDKCVNNPPENLIGCEVNYVDNPWCPKELIEQAERMKREDPARYEHIWLGKPVGQGGLVYPQYNPDIHEIDFDYDYLSQCDLYMSIDPHRKYYPAIKWYAVTPSNTVVVYNEWPKIEDTDGRYYDEVRETRSFDLTMKQLGDIILANDILIGAKIRRTGDPRFLNENPDIVRSLMSNGVHGWEDAPFERIETQRENLKDLLGYNPAIPIVGINVPGWFIDKRCRNSARAYRRHVYAEGKDKESETHKDFIDVDRYFLSILDGKPKFKGRVTVKPKQLKSLSSTMLEGLPSHF